MPKDVFAGRKGFIKTFRDSLEALEWEAKESKGLKLKRQKESPGESPRLFVVCGESGTGKSALVRRLVSAAEEYEAESKKGLKTITVDFSDQLFTRNILPFTPRMLVGYLYSVLANPSLGMEEHYSEFLSVDRRLDSVMGKVSALRRDEWLKEPADSRTPDPAVEQANSRPANAQGGAPGRSRATRHEAEAAFLRWLREQKHFPEEDLELFENADYRLTKALVNGLVNLSSERTLVLAIDNLDRVSNPLVHQWLRSVFLARTFERKSRIVAVVSSRDPLIRQYRNEFSEEQLCALSLDNLPLSLLDIEECNAELRLGFASEAARVIEEATAGVPMVVRDVVTYSRDGGIGTDVLDPLEKALTTYGKMSTITTRFFSFSQEAKARARIIQMAMLGSMDAKILAGLWEMQVSGVGAEITKLSDRYPFVDAKGLQRGVCELFRKYLLAESAKSSSPYAAIIKESAQAAFKQYSDLLSQLDAAVPSPDKRFVDERYEAMLLGCVSSLLWYDHESLKTLVMGAFCQCLLYNQVLAGRILAALREFSRELPPGLIALIDSLSAGFLASEGQPLWGSDTPSPAELGMLTALDSAAGSLSAMHQAMLRLRFAGCAYRSHDYSRVLNELDKCEAVVGESDLFCDMVLEGYCRTGAEFHSAKQFELAIRAFGKAAEISPSRHDVWYNLGASYGALKRHGQAEECFAKAAACKPDGWEALAALGTEQFELKKFGEAAASYEKAAALNPRDVDTWHMLGLSHAAVAKHAEAVEAYKKAIALLSSDAQVWFDMAESQAAAGRREDAVASCRKALELNPQHRNAAELLGRQLSAAGDFGGASAAFETAVSLDSQNQNLWYDLGCAQLSAGNAEKAETSFTKATDIKDDFADAYNKLGLACVAANKPDAAVAAYKRAVKAAPAHFEAYNNLGKVYVSKNEIDGALKAFEKSVSANPEFAAAWYNMGLAYYNAERFADALEPFSKAAALSPAGQDAWLAKGRSLSRLDRNDEAAQCFAQAAEVAPQSFDAWFERGRACATVGKHDEAVAAFVKATALSPKHAEAWRRLGMSHAAQKRHDSAIVAFSTAVSVDPKDGEAWHLLGVSNREDGRFEDAVTAFREAANIAPDKQESWHNAGLCSYYQNKHDDAIEFLGKARDLSPDNKDTIYTLGLSYHAKAQYSEAAALYTRTLELAPDMLNARTNLALSLHALGRYEEAVAAYRKIVEVQPQNAEVWYNLGLACEAQGKGEDAVEAYGKAVAAAPERLDAWANRGSAQISLEKYADAIASFEKVVEAQEANADAWTNIALASYYLGRYDNAVAAYSKVILLKPGDVMTLGSLGLTYYAMGDYVKSIEASQQALAVKPGELWIQVNLALASTLALKLDTATAAFEKIIELAKEPGDLMHPIASLKELVARNPNLVPAKEILGKLEDAWRKLKK